MKTRIITGVIGGAAYLTLLMLGGLWYTWLLVILAALAFYEIIKMKKMSFFQFPVMFASFFIVLFVSGAFQSFRFFSTFEQLFVLFLTVLLVITVLSKNKFNFEDAAYLFIGGLYVAFGFYYMVQTRQMEYGLITTLLIILSTWATDTGAYFTGKAFGKRKLWPSISPNKTIEGALGGIVSSIIVALGIGLLSSIPLTVWQCVLLGFIIAVVGQLGDLVESALKRSLHTKDSGNIIPGHGGVLDRFDSLIYVFPIVHVLQLLNW